MSHLSFRGRQLGSLVGRFFSFFLLTGLDCREQRLDRDAATCRQLTARTTHGRDKRRGPGVLPHQHAGRTARLDGGGERIHILLAEEHRQLRLVRPQVSDLSLIQVGKLKRLNRPVVILLQHQEVKHTDQITLDQIKERGHNLPIHSATRNSTTIQSTGPSSSAASTSFIDTLLFGLVNADVVPLHAAHVVAGT
jgi:hypothetical protein